MRHLFLLTLICFWNSSFAQTPKVLIIGIDGCRPDALLTANTPNIDALASNGTYTWDALNNDVTYSGPGWSAMLTGVWSDKHGVTDNSFIGSNYGNYPHFFQRVEAHLPTLNTASICHWSPINNQMAEDHADYTLNVSADADVASQGANYLANNDVDALFLHFDDCDGAGHGTGFSASNSNYISTIEITDTYIGTVLNSLYNRPNYANENWLILLSTDHGGIGTSHGGSSIEEERIFIIASGDQIPNQKIERDSTLTPLAPNCLDESTELFFDGSGDYVEIPNSSFFNFGSDQDFTIECRVRTTNAADVAIIGNKDWDSGLNNGFVFSFKYASGPEWKVNIGDGIFRADLNTGGAIANDEWHTLSVTFDRDGDMTMYEDGIFMDATSISFIGDIDSGNALRFGADAFADYGYTGSIAEVRVWDKILAPTEINNWSCANIDNSHPDFGNLLGYWQMNEGVGSNQVLDSSGNNNHGTIQNATWIDSPTYSVVYDYSLTPRITDIALSALAHLCIPINTSWNLDGFPLFSSCPIFIDDCVETNFTLPHIYQNHYHATQTIISNAIIDGAAIQFKAGNCIKLDPLFEVKTGNDFEAEIIPCDSN